jgi:hypothetical protein
VRRRTQQLCLNAELGLGKKSRFTRDQKIAIVAVIVAVILGAIKITLSVTVPEVRLRLGLDKPAPTAAKPSK